MSIKVGDRVRITAVAQQSMCKIWEKRPGGMEMIAAWTKVHRVVRISDKTVTLSYLPEANRPGVTNFTLMRGEVELVTETSECTCDSRDLFFFGHRNCSARK